MHIINLPGNRKLGRAHDGGTALLVGVKVHKICCSGR